MTTPTDNRGAVRVILLLDLDCFYAQCERVRLGLDSETCSLALLQWNSVLAVTYPARKFGVKRGDSWDAVKEKSKGSCIAIHLQLLQNNNEKDATAAVDATTGIVTPTDDVKEAYDKAFRLSHEKRESILKSEVGRQRSPSEGKACLERYRLASTRIFGVVLETLERRLKRGNFILERASIDELFLDVTDYCSRSSNDEGFDGLQDTNVVGGDVDSASDNNSDVVSALRRGSWVAKMVRQAVLDELGFTLSAGISTSKLVAKLGASYGKPNGQAVIFPNAMSFVMNETPIRKVRGFGRKAGKQVVALLPEGVEPTMGNLAKLSLPELAQALGPEMAKRVFDNSRGVDDESVKETVGALVKSITAFKSFYATTLESEQVSQWIQLLATDVCSRVQQDSHRNSRFPKSCNIQYTSSLRSSSDRTTKSVRIPFPKESPVQREELVDRVKEALKDREGRSVLLHRIGLAAVDFEVRMTLGGIDSFFGKKDDVQSTAPKNAFSETVELSEEKDDASIARQLEQDINGPTSFQVPSSPSDHIQSVAVDKDLELARKLQASYDRENSLHSVMEQRIKPTKRARIDTFFSRKTS